MSPKFHSAASFSPLSRVDLRLSQLLAQLRSIYKTLNYTALFALSVNSDVQVLARTLRAPAAQRRGHKEAARDDRRKEVPV